MPSLLDSLHTQLIQDFGPRTVQIMQIEHDPQLRKELRWLVHDMKQQLNPLLDAADSMLRIIQQRKGGRSSITMGSITGALTPLEACWMLGSVFKSLVLLHNIMLTVGKSHEAEPLWCTIMLVCEVICPGSHMDIVLATNGAYRAGPPNLPFPGVEAAQQGLTRALHVRYGKEVAQDPIYRGWMREGVVAVAELVLSRGPIVAL